MISKRDLFQRIQALEAGLSAEIKLRHNLSNRLDQHLNAEAEKAELPPEGTWPALVREISPPSAYYSPDPKEPTQYSVRFQLYLDSHRKTVFMHMGGTLDTCNLLYDMRGSLGGRKMLVNIKHKAFSHGDDTRVGLQTRFLRWAD